jgi:cation-transporting P-type ATPase 13A2
MFDALGWTLTDHVEDAECAIHTPTDSINGYFKPNETINVIKRFEFVPKLQRMSVIVKEKNESLQRMYIKGSPERLRELCIESTLPKDFDEVLSKYTQVTHINFLDMLERFKSSCLCYQGSREKVYSKRGGRQRSS